MKKHILITATIIAATSLNSAISGPIAETASSDKSQYTWFNPTPRDQMRELSPDRPDFTESPLSVDAGHYVFEVSFFDWRRNAGTDTYTAMATNFKIGLTNNMDLQTVFNVYSWENPTTGTGNRGFGDVQFRLKYNLFGNDEGDIALGLLPFIKVPTGTPLSNGTVEGGFAIPFSMSLTDRIGLGLMVQFDSVYNDVTTDHDFEFAHTAVLGFDLTERLALYTEYIGISGDTRYQVYFSGGFTWTVNEDLVLDCGTQIGMNDNSEELGVFAGITKRF